MIESITKVVSETPLPDHSSKEELVNDFGNFFQKKIDLIRDKIDKVLKDENIPSEVNYENCGNCSQSELHDFKNLTEEDVKKLVRKCSSKHCVLDPAPTTLIKECLDVLLPIITLIVNKSLQSGYFTSCYKCSVVIPLIKKLDLERVFQSYRPVSNLPFISKVIESAAVSQYRDHLVDNQQMPIKNAAYSKNQSTETILTRVHSDILQGMDNQNVTLLVLLDLSAAFDTIDFNILSSIFTHKFKISGSVAAWFKSYLTDRRQKILIDGVFSEEFDLKYGVPHGSVAGPVTFLSYLSSLHDLIEEYQLNVAGFADDNQLY